MSSDGESIPRDKRSREPPPIIYLLLFVFRYLKLDIWCEEDFSTSIRTRKTLPHLTTVLSHLASKRPAPFMPFQYERVLRHSRQCRNSRDVNDHSEHAVLKHLNRMGDL